MNFLYLFDSLWETCSDLLEFDCPAPPPLRLAIIATHPPPRFGGLDCHVRKERDYG
jgi:hypothetical protein